MFYYVDKCTNATKMTTELRYWSQSKRNMGGNNYYLKIISHKYLQHINLIPIPKKSLLEEERWQPVQFAKNESVTTSPIFSNLIFSSFGNLIQ